MILNKSIAIIASDTWDVGTSRTVPGDTAQTSVADSDIDSPAVVVCVCVFFFIVLFLTLGSLLPMAKKYQ